MVRSISALEGRILAILNAKKRASWKYETLSSFYNDNKSTMQAVTHGHAFVL